MAATRIYIAAALETLPRAAALGDSLRGAGFDVVSDWHNDTANTREAERTLSISEQRTVCEYNFARIRLADIVMVLASPSMRGTIAEAAYAHAHRKIVVAAGSRREHTLMLAFASWWETEEHALQYLDEEGLLLRRAS